MFLCSHLPLLPLFHNDSEAREKGCDKDVPLEDEYSIVSNYLHIKQLCVNHYLLQKEAALLRVEDQLVLV